MRSFADLTGQSTSKTGDESVVKSILVPVGSLLIAGLSLMAKDVPFWVTALAVTYIVLVLAIILFDVLRRAIRWIYNARRTHAMSQRYRVEIHRYLVALSDVLKQDRADTPFAVLRQAGRLESEFLAKQAGSDQVWRGMDVEAATLQLTSLWVTSRALIVLAENIPSRKFGELCDLVGRLLVEYQRSCEQARERVASALSRPIAHENFIRSLKNEWDQARERFNQKMRDWERLASQINHAAGNRICFDYISVLKGL